MMVLALVTCECRFLKARYSLHKTSPVAQQYSAASSFQWKLLIERLPLLRWPLPPGHPDALAGHTTLRLDEVNNILTDYRKSQRKRNTQPQIIKPPRRIYNHYLTTPATLRAIAQSLGIEPKNL
jgi:hypothetical protein